MVLLCQCFSFFFFIFFSIFFESSFWMTKQNKTRKKRTATSDMRLHKNMWWRKSFSKSKLKSEKKRITKLCEGHRHKLFNFLNSNNARYGFSIFFSFYYFFIFYFFFALTFVIGTVYFDSPFPFRHCNDRKKEKKNVRKITAQNPENFRKKKWVQVLLLLFDVVFFVF